MLQATDWIERLSLLPHPEGGWYRELHRAATPVRRPEDGAERAGLTVIAYLLRSGERSRWHRVRGSDEVWHHGGGAPLELLRLAPGGGSTERLRLGPLGEEPAPPQAPLQVIPAGWWQAARSLGPWSLTYCCVGPGFDYADFSLLADLPVPERPPGADPFFL